jgi:ABC-type glycerol-3-phosphate transport system permease component
MKAVETTGGSEQRLERPFVEQPRAARGWAIAASRALPSLATYVLLLLGSLMFVTPFLFALSSSVKKLDGVYAYPPSLWPAEPQWGNYSKAVTLLPFGLFLANSALVTAACVVGQLLTGALVAYSFARLRWPGRDVMFVVLLSTMMLPGQVTMIPTFIMWTHLRDLTGVDWVGTFKPLIVPAFLGGAPVYIFLLRQFFKGIPLELEEAARIDGCSTWQIFRRIVLPLSRPVLATVGVLSFIAHWHDFMGPLIYLDRVEMYTLQLGLRMFQTVNGSFAHYLMAASMLVLLPVLVLFFLAQRQLVRGIALSGIKG